MRVSQFSTATHSVIFLDRPLYYIPFVPRLQRLQNIFMSADSPTRFPHAFDSVYAGLGISPDPLYLDIRLKNRGIPFRFQAASGLDRIHLYLFDSSSLNLFIISLISLKVLST